MADIFISYSSADRPRAKEVADALAAQGFSVWWDRKIPTGEAFDEELERQIEAARAIVVLWSPASVRSRWVRDEASEGLARKTLFPVLIDEACLPFGYRRIQTVDLRQWHAGEAQLGFDQLVASLRRHFGGGRGDLQLQGDDPAPPPRPPNWLVDRWRRSVAFRLGALLLPAVVMGVGALVMMNLRWPVRVLLELPVSRVGLTSAAGKAAAVLELPAFTALTIERFRSVAFHPRQLRAVPAEREVSADGGATPWVTLPLSDAGVTLHGGDESLQPSVRLERSDAQGSKAPASAGQLDALRLQPGTTLTLERRGDRPSLLIAMDGQSINPAVMAHGPLRLDTLNVTAPGAGGSGPMVYDTQLRESSPEIRITGGEHGLTLRVTLRLTAPVDLVAAGGVPVSALELVEMATEDRWASTLVADARISFPDHPGVAALSVAKGDLLGVHGLQRATVTALSMDPKAEGLQLRLDGRVSQLTARAGEFSRDLRPTVLDLYRASANAVFLATLILGGLSATWSMFIAWRELRG